MRHNPPTRLPAERIKDFNEVTLGFNAQQAQQEASRCLQCKNAPCVKACPVHIDIPGFIRRIKDDKASGSYAVIRQSSIFPGVCGRVCPQEELCEGSCVLAKKNIAINIGKLERFSFDSFSGHSQTHPEPLRKDLGRVTGVKVAIAGSGPSGLSGAYFLALNGCAVTVFESLHDYGGVLRYGIPEFRLPKHVVDAEIEELRKMGVTFRKNILIGKTLSFDDLFHDGFKAVLVASGAGLPKMIHVEGENANGVYSANEFLFRVNFMKGYMFPRFHTPVEIGKNVIVIGGGNVAFDCARVARRMGSDVIVAYRRIRKYMPARAEEIENAVEEGIDIREFLSPVSFTAPAGRITEAVFRKTELVDHGGKRPDFRETDQIVTVPADTVIVAVGQDPNRLIPESESLVVTEKGTIKVDDHFAASKPGVFASGDIISGAATVIAAMETGTRAAQAIIEYLKKDRQ